MTYGRSPGFAYLNLNERAAPLFFLIMGQAFIKTNPVPFSHSITS